MCACGRTYSDIFGTQQTRQRAALKSRKELKVPTRLYKLPLSIYTLADNTLSGSQTTRISPA